MGLPRDDAGTAAVQAAGCKETWERTEASGPCAKAQGAAGKEETDKLGKMGRLRCKGTDPMTHSRPTSAFLTAPTMLSPSRGTK